MRQIFIKPFILINGYQFAPTDVIRFELNLMGDLPECEIELSDEAGKFAVGSYPRDGDFFTILINSKNQETFKSIPLEKTLIETDSPYLAPVPNRGKKNEPSFVKYTAIKLADIKEISLSDLIKNTTSNFNRLFS